MFFLTLRQMLVMATLITVGFSLRKLRVLPDNASSVMSRLEMYAITPALSLYTQITRCTVENFAKNFNLMLYGFAVVLCCIVIAIPLSSVFSKENYSRNIYKYALAFGNYGYMGNFIVLELFGNDVFYQYSLVVFFVGIACSSWGLYVLIPKDKNANFLSNLKAFFITPPFIALLTGIVLGLTGVGKYVPEFLLKAFESAGNCQGPIAMLLAGFVIGGFDLKKLFGYKKVYAVSLLRLIVIPSVIAIVLRALNVDNMTVLLLLIAFATPIGLNTVVYPAVYDADTETGASMTVISHLLSVITLPLIFELFT